MDRCCAFNVGMVSVIRICSVPSSGPNDLWFSCVFLIRFSRYGFVFLVQTVRVIQICEVCGLFVLTTSDG